MAVDGLFRRRLPARLQRSRSLGLVVPVVKGPRFLGLQENGNVATRTDGERRAASNRRSGSPRTGGIDGNGTSVGVQPGAWNDLRGTQGDLRLVSRDDLRVVRFLHLRNARRD